jgi:hypothetical protein
MTDPAESSRFPTMQVDTLVGTPVTLPDLWHGKVTLVSVGLRAFSKPMVEEYRTAFMKRFSDQAGCQFYEINMVDQYIYRTLLGNTIKTNMAKELADDPVRQRQTLCYLGADAAALKDKLGVKDPPSPSAECRLVGSPGRGHPAHYC